MKVTNRKEVEEFIYGCYDRADPSGRNTEKMRNTFESMDDAEFAKFMKEFLDNPDDNFTFDLTEYENELKLENIEKAAKFLKVPLMEYVYMPHLTMDRSNVVVTKEKCLTGYQNTKRTQQFRSKKNGYSTANDKRSMLTDQVVNKDKNARDSDIEAFMLTALGCDKILQELHGPRADDRVMKEEMNQSIATKGYVMLDELTNLSTNKTTLNTVNTFLIGMGLMSDLVTDSYILPKLSKELFE